ncbi:serine hydrolase [Pontibacter sp. G13]|uniref:serine hydrolase n=1 Tax=Pontibacter sp. G13 TaxID=3074898 RepID=UPI0028895CC9|nr:serine hydrolase [Pontibacter sp. G13]WNJ16026.1 serine hydrolase [Pontibacter sp. G13]
MNAPRLSLYIFSFCLLLVCFAGIYSSHQDEEESGLAFLDTESRWADSTFFRMSTRDKLAQMILVVAEGDSCKEEVDYALSNWAVGGVVCQSLNPEWQYELTRAWQVQSKRPLLMGVVESDAMNPLMELPQGAQIAAIQDDSLLMQAGANLAGKLRKMGTHLYLPDARTSHFRSYNQGMMGEKVGEFSEGISQGRILACPTQTYPYYPKEFDSLRLEQRLEPYRALTHHGAAGMLVQPSLIDRIHLNSRKKRIVKTYLHERMGFEGLIMAQLVDSLGDYEEQIWKMVKAGTEMILVNPKQVPKVWSTLFDLYRSGQLPPEVLDEQVKRILAAKAWAGVPKAKAWAAVDRPLQFRSGDEHQLERKMIHQQLAIVKDEADWIPLSDLGNGRTHLITLGRSFAAFEKQLGWYDHLEQIKVYPRLPRKIDLEGIEPGDRVIVCANDSLKAWIDRSPDFLKGLTDLQRSNQVVFVNLGALAQLEVLAPFQSIVQAYQDGDLYQEMASQVIYGGLASRGKIPLEIGQDFAFLQGEVRGQTRLGYGSPELQGLSSEVLAQIDVIAEDAIAQRAMPGCQVLVAKSGQVIYHKAFGHQTYAKRVPINLNHIYDIASVTKVAATTVATMSDVSAGKIDLNAPLGNFFSGRYVRSDSLTLRDTIKMAKSDLMPSVVSDTVAQPMVQKVSNVPDQEIKVDTLTYSADTVLLVTTTHYPARRYAARIFDIPLKDLLTHRSGLPPGLPIISFLRQRTRSRGADIPYFAKRPSSEYSIEVANEFFLSRQKQDMLWQKTKLIRPGRKIYEYSDANMVLLQRALDSLHQEPLDKFLDRTLYAPLGMHRTMFNPLDRFEKSEIVPTERDVSWRRQLLQGHVHDPTAALQGGVSGNAGLFSNANGLAHLFQMLLNGGTYGGTRYMSTSTVRQFTRRASEGHRGLGFDKPTRSGNYIIGKSASLNSYGHTGFTGTCVWVDPDHDLVYIFLSNRVHPKPTNWRISSLKVRESIHEVVYEAIALAEHASM